MTCYGETEKHTNTRYCFAECKERPKLPAFLPSLSVPPTPPPCPEIQLSSGS